MNLISKEIEQYCLDQSQADSGLLKDLVNKTFKEEKKYKGSVTYL